MSRRGTRAFKEEKVKRWVVDEEDIRWLQARTLTRAELDVLRYSFSPWCYLTLSIVVACSTPPAVLVNVHSPLSSRILLVYATMLLLERSPHLCWPILRNPHQIRRL